MSEFQVWIVQLYASKTKETKNERPFYFYVTPHLAYVFQLLHTMQQTTPNESVNHFLYVKNKLYCE